MEMKIEKETKLMCECVWSYECVIWLNLNLSEHKHTSQYNNNEEAP